MRGGVGAVHRSWKFHNRVRILRGKHALGKVRHHSIRLEDGKIRSTHAGVVRTRFRWRGRFDSDLGTVEFNTPQLNAMDI